MLDGSEKSRKDFYDSEGFVYGKRGYIWKGAIALMYASDMAYSTSSTNSICDTNFASWGSECVRNSWLAQAGLTEFVLNPFYGSDWQSYYISYNGGTISYGESGDARPALYLKSNVKIKSGTGTSSDPFILTQ